MQMYLKTLGPMAHDIAAALRVPDAVAGPGVSSLEIGAAYLKAFLDDLSARLAANE